MCAFLDQLDTTDMEMSALNWSASNSKCCALSSTKADDILPRGDACITPDLTAPSVDRNICTPDLFDLIMGGIGGAMAPAVQIRSFVLRTIQIPPHRSLAELNSWLWRQLRPPLPLLTRIAHLVRKRIKI